MLSPLPPARPTRALLAGVLLVSLAACSTGANTPSGNSSGDVTGTPGPPAFPDATVQVPAEQSSPLAAPAVDDTSALLELADGTSLALWIDPDDERRVLVQQSSAQAQEWTAPTVLATAGDGCLLLRAAAERELAAATLYCYATDAFIEQAPDQAYGVATTGDGTWHVQEHLELTGTPTFTETGVLWPEQLTWSPTDGFEPVELTP